jgi:hypothetical protein
MQTSLRPLGMGPSSVSHCVPPIMSLGARTPNRRDRRLDYRTFLIRRFFRIVPSYSAALVIYGIAYYALPALAVSWSGCHITLP